MSQLAAIPIVPHQRASGRRFARQRAMVLHLALSIARTHCVTGNTSIGAVPPARTCANNSIRAAQHADSRCRGSLQRRTAPRQRASARRFARQQTVVLHIASVIDLSKQHLWQPCCMKWKAVFRELSLQTTRSEQSSTACGVVTACRNTYSYHTNEHRPGVSLDSRRKSLISP